jgi:hypothetical protein
MGIICVITLCHGVHSILQSRVEWVRRAPHELGSDRPHGAEILNKLCASREISQNVLAAAPIFYLQAIVPEHLVSEVCPIVSVTLTVTLVVSGLRAHLPSFILYMSIRPVGLCDELSTQYTHYKVTSALQKPRIEMSSG